MDQSAEAALQHGWQEVLDHWEDPEAHKRLLALGDCMGELTWVARKYRALAAQAPERANSAQEHLNRVLAISLSRFDTMRASESMAPSDQDRAKRWLLMAALVVTAMMVWWTFKSLLSALSSATPN